MCNGVDVEQAVLSETPDKLEKEQTVPWIR